MYIKWCWNLTGAKHYRIGQWGDASCVQYFYRISLIPVQLFHQYHRLVTLLNYLDSIITSIHHAHQWTYTILADTNPIWHLLITHLAYHVSLLTPKFPMHCGCNWLDMPSCFTQVQFTSIFWTLIANHLNRYYNKLIPVFFKIKIMKKM